MGVDFYKIDPIKGVSRSLMVSGPSIETLGATKPKAKSTVSSCLERNTSSQLDCCQDIDLVVL